MKKIIASTIYYIDALNTKVGQGVAWLTTALVLLVCVDVFRRYFLGATTVAIIELEWHFFALIFLLSAGYSLKEDKHVRVDVFYNRFSPRAKAWVNLIGSIIFLVPFCLVVIYTAFDFSLRSYFLNEGSPNPGGLPARYLVKGAIVLGMFFLFLQSISLILSCLMTIMGFQNPQSSGQNNPFGH